MQKNVMWVVANKMRLICYSKVVLGGAVSLLAYLPLDPSFVSSDTVEGDGFLRAIKICSTPFFGGKVKPSAPSRANHSSKESYQVYETSGVRRPWSVQGLQSH
jgi:hypothetical protein